MLIIETVVIKSKQNTLHYNTNSDDDDDDDDGWVSKHEKHTTLTYTNVDLKVLSKGTLYLPLKHFILFNCCFRNILEYKDCAVQIVCVRSNNTENNNKVKTRNQFYCKCRVHIQIVSYHHFTVKRDLHICHIIPFTYILTL